MTSDGGKIRNAEKVVVLVNVCEKSGVKVHALLVPEDASQANGYCLKRYGVMDSLLDFKLDSPRSQSNRAAVAVISKVEMSGTGVVVGGVEHVDKDCSADAAKTMKQLLMLSSFVKTDEPESGKRVIAEISTPPSSVKKCQTLTDQLSDARL